MGGAIVALVILVLNAGLWWRLRKDDQFLRNYVKHSPKAILWRKAFGEERAAEIIRTRLVPLGIAVWVGLFVLFIALDAMGVEI